MTFQESAFDFFLLIAIVFLFMGICFGLSVLGFTAWHEFKAILKKL